MTLHQKLEAETLFITDLTLSEVRLINNQQYPWVILVPKVEDVVELMDLTQPQQHLLMDEINQVSKVLTHLYKPDKINVAALGNIVAQLHVHVIARYHSDPAWPSPVWGYPGTPYSAENLEKTLKALKQSMLSFKDVKF